MSSCLPQSSDRAISTHFPSASSRTFDTFLAQSVPRWDCNNELTQHAYDALLRRMERGAIVLTHRQGGNFGLTAAVAVPGQVRAVISLEPSGAPNPEQQDARLLKKCHTSFCGATTWTNIAFGCIPGQRWNGGAMRWKTRVMM